MSTHPAGHAELAEALKAAAQDQANTWDPHLRPEVYATIIRAIDAALASEAASQMPADGWQPGEVTQTMIDAGEEARLAHTDIYMDGSEVAGAGIIEAIYHAMIAAAPDHEGPADGK